MSGRPVSQPFTAAFRGWTDALRDTRLAFVMHAAMLIVVLPATAGLSAAILARFAFRPPVDEKTFAFSLLDLAKLPASAGPWSPELSAMVAAMAATMVVAAVVSIPFTVALTFRALGGDRRHIPIGSAAANAWRFTPAFLGLLCLILLADLAVVLIVVVLGARLPALLLPPEQNARLLLTLGLARLAIAAVAIAWLHRVLAHARTALVAAGEIPLLDALGIGLEVVRRAPLTALLTAGAASFPTLSFLLVFGALDLSGPSTPFWMALFAHQGLIYLRQLQKCATVRAEACLHLELADSWARRAPIRDGTFSMEELVLSGAELTTTGLPKLPAPAEPALAATSPIDRRPDPLVADPPVPDPLPENEAAVASAGADFPARPRVGAETALEPTSLPATSAPSAIPSPPVPAEDAASLSSPPESEPTPEEALEPEPAKDPLATVFSRTTEIPPLLEVVDEPGVPNEAIAWPANIEGIEQENELAAEAEAEELRSWKPPLGDLPTEELVLRAYREGPDPEPADRPARGGWRSLLPFRRRTTKAWPPYDSSYPRRATGVTSPAATAWTPLLEPVPIPDGEAEPAPVDPPKPESEDS